MELLTLVQKWPRRTHHSIYDRAIYQSERLHKAEKEAGENFVIAKSKADLRKALTARASNKDMLVGALATEGAHPLEDDIHKIMGENQIAYFLKHLPDE